MRETAIDLRSGARALRRRWRFLATAGAAGALVATTYAVASPPSLDSTSLILLSAPSSATQSTTSVASTQVAIALSTEVLSLAGQSMVPRLSSTQMRERTQVSAPTDELIQIDGLGSSGGQAQAVSRAVANAYITVVREATRSVTAASLTDLTARENTLDGQMTGLQSALQATTARERGEDPNSADGVRDAQLEAQLRTEQADVSLELDKVKGDIATGQSYGSTTDTGISLIQPATPGTSPSRLLWLLGWAAAGLLVGLLGGAAAVAVRARRDRRLWLRDDIADALGSPVLATVTPAPQRSAAGWSGLAATYEPAAVDAWALRQALRALSAGDGGPRPAADPRRPYTDTRQRPSLPGSLLVVCLAGDTPALAVGVQLASYAASRGVRTRLLTGGSAEGALPLRSAWSGGDPEPRPGLSIGTPGPDEGAPTPEPVQFTVALWTVDRGRPSIADAPATTATVLAVSPGAASSDDLARVAVAVDDGRRTVDGVLMADAEASDRTSGRRPPADRRRQPPLPMRVGAARPGVSALADRISR